MDKRAAHRLPSIFLPCSCVANRPTDLVRVSCVSCGAVGKKQGERENESESQTGSWQHNIMSVGRGRGRARRAAGAEWERAGLSFSFVWRDLTKWRFVQKTTTLYPHCEREGWREGWMDGGPLEFPFSTAIKTRSTEPHRIWRHGG